MTLFLAREAFRPLDRLEKEFHAAWNGVSAAPLIANLLAASAAVKEPAAPLPPPARSDVTFDAVRFAYDGAEAAALKSVSFAIARASAHRARRPVGRRQVHHRGAAAALLRSGGRARSASAASMCAT